MRHNDTHGDFSFKGKVALVTGASSGIGRAIAAALAEREAMVWRTGRNLKNLESIATSAPGGIIAADLSDPLQVESLAETVATRACVLDVLIHCAGAIAFGAVQCAEPSDFDYQWHVNLRAPFLLTQRLLPLLKARRGQIVFINSSAGLRAVAGSGQYSATKHALKGLADGLREEVNAHGVRVVSLYVGRTATPMQAAVHVNEGRVYYPESLIQPEDIASLVIHALSLPPTVEVTDLQVRPARCNRM